MEEKDIIAKIDSILIDKLGLEKNEITPEAEFNQLGADSLDNVEIQTELEVEFDLLLEDDKVEKVLIVQDLYDLVIKAVQEKA